MKFIYSALAPLMAFFIFSLNASDLRLKDDTVYSDVQITQKDQYGVLIDLRKHTLTDTMIQKYIPFSKMAAQTLALFPFCDEKSAALVTSSLADRVALIKSRHEERLKLFSTEDADYVKLQTAPLSVSRFQILFQSEKNDENGSVGFVFPDTVDAPIYGKYYLEDLDVSPGDIWCGTVYRLKKSALVGGKTYPAFSIYRPKRETETENTAAPGTDPKRPEAARPPREVRGNSNPSRPPKEARQK